MHTSDVVFLLHLLYHTNETIFREILDFASADFHHELLEYLSNRAWPLEKLKSLVKPAPAMQSLKIIDANLITIPPAVRHMSHLVEIDVSSNNHLFDISNISSLENLKYLKIRSCNIRDIDCLMEIKTLVRLDVSNNKIVHLPAEIKQLTNLAYFYVKFNRLTELPAELLSLPALNFVSVEGRLLDGLDSDHVFFERHPFIRGAFLRQILVEPKTPDDIKPAIIETKDAEDVETAPVEKKQTGSDAGKEEEETPAPVVDVIAEPIHVSAVEREEKEQAPPRRASPPPRAATPPRRVSPPPRAASPPRRPSPPPRASPPRRSSPPGRSSPGGDDD